MFPNQRPRLGTARINQTPSPADSERVARRFKTRKVQDVISAEHARGCKQGVRRDRVNTEGARPRVAHLYPSRHLWPTVIPRQEGRTLSINSSPARPEQTTELLHICVLVDHANANHSAPVRVLTPEPRRAPPSPHRVAQVRPIESSASVARRRRRGGARACVSEVLAPRAHVVNCEYEPKPEIAAEYVC